MIEESICYTNMMQKEFNDKLVVTKENDEDFEKSAECFLPYNAYFDGNVKVRDHRHITRKYRGSVQRNCSINIKVDHKIPIVFLKNYESHLIMQEIGQFKIKNLGLDQKNI